MIVNQEVPYEPGSDRCEIIPPVPVQQQPQYASAQPEYVARVHTPEQISLLNDGEHAGQKRMLSNGKRTAVFLFFLSFVTWALFFLSAINVVANMESGIDEGGFVSVFEDRQHFSNQQFIAVIIKCNIINN